MRKAALKITSCLLCGLLIYNSLGYFMVLTAMRMAVRQQKWAQLSVLPESDLTLFVVNKNYPESRFRIENKHEIVVDGKLYDVVRTNQKGLQTIYYCVHDKEEESLIYKTRLFNSQAQQMPVQQITRMMVEKIIKTAVTIDKSNPIAALTFISFLNFSQKKYAVPDLHISLPPPQFIG
jgi:hypothetical protein